MAFPRSLQLIFLTCTLLALSTATTQAEPDTVLRFSPIIIVDSNQSQHDDKVVNTAHNIHKQTQLAANTPHTQDRLSIGDLDDYSLSLGATLHINDNLDIGAACGLPFVNEEPVQLEDLSIAAMVTMQF